MLLEPRMRVLAITFLFSLPARADWRLSFLPAEDAAERRLHEAKERRRRAGPLAETIIGSMLASSGALLVTVLAPIQQYSETTIDPMSAVRTTRPVYGRANYMELGIGLSLAFVGWPLAFHGQKELDVADGKFGVRF
jgi:hypothetical protein